MLRTGYQNFWVDNQQGFKQYAPACVRQASTQFRRLPMGFSKPQCLEGYQVSSSRVIEQQRTRQLHRPHALYSYRSSSRDGLFPLSYSSTRLHHRQQQYYCLYRHISSGYTLGRRELIVKFWVMDSWVLCWRKSTAYHPW